MDTIQAKYSKPILPTMQLCKTFRGGKKKNLQKTKTQREFKNMMFDGRWSFKGFGILMPTFRFCLRGASEDFVGVGALVETSKSVVGG
jgi:hypothetical protein